MPGPIVGEDGLARCPWTEHPTNRAYHDAEWGVPISGEQAWFERLSLEGFQAGLSWLTILTKREDFRRVFHGFDPERVAAMSDAEVETAMADPSIVRNRAKIESTRRNAAATIALREDGGLEALIAAHRPAEQPAPQTSEEVATTSPESHALSKALRARGFGFVGPTTMHALLEATGMFDPHLVGCFRRGA